MLTSLFVIVCVCVCEREREREREGERQSGINLIEKFFITEESFSH